MLDGSTMLNGSPVEEISVPNLVPSSRMQSVGGGMGSNGLVDHSRRAVSMQSNPVRLI